MASFHCQIVDVSGMQSDECVRRLYRALGNVAGVRVYSIAVGKAKILAQSSSEPAIRDTVEHQGFHVVALHEEAESEYNPW